MEPCRIVAEKAQSRLEPLGYTVEVKPGSYQVKCNGKLIAAADSDEPYEHGWQVARHHYFAVRRGATLIVSGKD